MSERRLDDAERAFVLEVTGARGIAGATRIQSLWGGCGDLLRVSLRGGTAESVVLKSIRLPSPSPHERVSHERKRRSYLVEAAFYRQWARRCPPEARVPAGLGERFDDERGMLLLEDLDGAGYPERRPARRGRELDACLDWLAAFHATFLGAAPEGLWPVGTYWQLETRREELERMADRALAGAADELHRALRGARFQTLVHGDAKPANFCFTPGGDTAAAVDFQYVGGGPGVRDVAYLLHGAPADLVAHGLDRYLAGFTARLSNEVDAAAAAEECRALFPVATRDFERFLSGWRT